MKSNLKKVSYFEFRDHIKEMLLLYVRVVLWTEDQKTIYVYFGILMFVGLSWFITFRIFTTL